tara:strand:+ start:129 stop:569 length:441 start_codon:yes stop_codon:yes gene_type:complete
MTDSIVVNTAVLMPVFALITWSLIIFIRMYAMRMPAMAKAGIDPQSVKHPTSLGGILPSKVEASSDNYNHLMEQPTIFYALCFYLALAGHADALQVQFAWGYVGFRVLHSLVQVTGNNVMARFSLFTLSTAALIAMVVFEIMQLMN